MEQFGPTAHALAFAQAASEAFADQAAFFRSLLPGQEHAPTGCSAWDMQALAGHIVGEAVWFPHLVRMQVEDAAALPDSLWQELKERPLGEIADVMEEAARGFVPLVQSATPDNLQAEVDLGFARMPLWQALYIGMLEGVLHNWDSKAGLDPSTTIPTPWALVLGRGMVNVAPMVANREAAAANPGRYLLQVADGLGPIGVNASDTGVQVEPAEMQNPDVTLALSADQYCRLITGRLPLGPAIHAGEVSVEGVEARAEALNAVFAGIHA